ncbi:MAG: antibiotic biosynthesis monooxygenase [Pirellula sp.]|jgi:hypothetical protein|nr:antibiotic biosynthesis monooxygenase [Pirellula sp.]
MPVVHCAVTRRVRPGCEEQFDEQLLAFVRQSIATDGVVGVHILRPAPGNNDREYGVLRSFESEAAAEKFYASDVFNRWLLDVEPLVEGEPEHRKLTGLEAFFRSERGWMPPRWKMAILTFMGVLPVALLWSHLLGPMLSNQHWLVRAASINVAVVSTLTWVVMPFLTKLFHSWLSQRQKYKEHTHGN